jgi:methyl-accepting chemotaxis protein
LQKERGRTNLFLASGATLVPAELRAQREATDAMIAELRNAFDGIDTNAQETNFKIAADKALTQVKLLTDYRKRVDDLQVTDAESFAYYTEVITSLLDTTSQEIVALSGDREISRLALAYLMLLQSKELAGRERALSPAPRASDEASTPLSAGRVKAWQPIAKGRGFDSLGDGQGDGSRAS